DEVHVLHAYVHYVLVGVEVVARKIRLRHCDLPVRAVSDGVGVPNVRGLSSARIRGRRPGMEIPPRRSPNGSTEIQWVARAVLSLKVLKVNPRRVCPHRVVAVAQIEKR